MSNTIAKFADAAVPALIAFPMAIMLATATAHAQPLDASFGLARTSAPTAAHAQTQLASLAPSAVSGR